MNDDNKIVNQNPNPVVPMDQAQPQTSVQPAVPPVPVGSVNKEAEPATSPVSEFVKPSEAEPQVSKDMVELGVEARKDAPNITDEHKDLIDHAGPHVPVSSASSNSIQYPMSEEEIADKLKTGQNDDSGRWLAGLIKKIIAWGFKSQ